MIALRWLSFQKPYLLKNKLFLFLILFQTYLFSQNSTNATLATANPIIDGNVLDDMAWNNANVITNFTQKSPDEGEPSSEKTIVKLIYSAKFLYVSVVCYDSNPNGIVISDSRRDAPLNNTDSFMFVLDTFKDQQNGYVFGTNAAGIEYDAQVIGGDGMSMNSSRQSVGVGANLNINWDASWEVKTIIGDFGWSAEFAIPFKTLRFSSQENQDWGINFQRNIAQKNEQSFWAPIPRQFSLNRLSLAGNVTGINIPSSRNIKIMPYALGLSNDANKEDVKSDETKSDYGFDAKIGITSSLNLDVTYNTDFAQVEADEQQINLDRFSLFFPEKRSFFLENAGLFSSGENTFYGPDIEMFFSRRIGIANDGSLVPILGGGRLTGEMGGFKIGALNMQTKEVKNIANAENYGVYRIRKELPNRTNFGALITSKNVLNSSANNRAYALDGAYGIGETIQLKGFLATSDLPADSDNNGDSYAYMLEANRNTQALTTQLRYSEVGKNFNPEMGYVRRLGYRKVLFRILNRTRPKDFYGILELRPHITYWSYWDFDGFQQSGYLHIDNHWEFRNGYRIDTAVNFIWEGVKSPFEIVNGVKVPNNSYANSELHTRFNSNLTKPISLIVVSKIGGFFSGNRRNTDTTLRFRLGERFTSEVISKYNDVSLPEGKFYTHLLRSRFTYAFNPQMYIQSLLQYNNQSDQWSMNWRFIWQQSAATGLYIVYNQTQDYDGIPTDLNIRSLVFKYSYLFDID